MNKFQSSLEGKKGIITGGTSGFGKELVRGLSIHGADITVFSVDDPEPELLEEMNESGRGTVRFMKQDIMETSAARTMVDSTVELFGGIDFVIANAGFAIRFEKPLLKTPVEEIAESLRTQFEVFPIAFASLALEAAKVMAPKFEAIEPDENGHMPDSGSIVITLSEAAVCNLRDDLLAYAAAKKASQWIMESLSGTLGPKNIRVNGIAPGFANNEGQKKFYNRYPTIRADIEARNHLKPGFMHPGSVVPAVVYLLTDNYVTGQTITLDGGYSNNMVRYFQ